MYIWSGSVLYLDNIQSHMFNVVAGFLLSGAKLVRVNFDWWWKLSEWTVFVDTTNTQTHLGSLTRVLQCSNETGSSTKSHDHVRKSRTMLVWQIRFISTHITHQKLHKSLCISPLRTPNMLTPWQGNWNWRSYWRLRICKMQLQRCFKLKSLTMLMTKFLLSRWSYCSLTIISGLFGRPKYHRNCAASVKQSPTSIFQDVFLKSGCLEHLLHMTIRNSLIR